MDALIYILTSWILSAIVAGFGQGFHLTIMLPLTSAICLTHYVFQHRRSRIGFMAFALILGYLEDIQQVMPVGTLTLVYLAAAILLMGLQRRFSLEGAWRSMITLFLLVVFIDTCTWLILFALSEQFSFNVGALRQTLTTVHWHALATMLATPVIWFVLDRIFVWLSQLSRFITYGSSRSTGQNRIITSQGKL